MTIIENVNSRYLSFVANIRRFTVEYSIFVRLGENSFETLIEYSLHL